jgi:hypothetical protein
MNNSNKQQDEYWKPLYGWEKGYIISNNGQIKTIGRSFLKKNGQIAHYKPKIIKQYIDNFGYLAVCLVYEGVRKTSKVHILVIKTFLDSTYRDKGLVVNHIDGGKANAKLSNLEIVTYSENMNHAHIKRLNRNIGDTHYKTVISDSEVIRIREVYSKGGISYRDIAKEYNVTTDHIADICRGKKRKLKLANTKINKQ